jgi:hypothetical protein
LKKYEDLNPLEIMDCVRKQPKIEEFNKKYAKEKVKIPLPEFIGNCIAPITRDWLNDFRPTSYKTIVGN